MDATETRQFVAKVSQGPRALGGSFEIGPPEISFDELRLGWAVALQPTIIDDQVTVRVALSRRSLIEERPYRFGDGAIEGMNFVTDDLNRLMSVTLRSGETKLLTSWANATSRRMEERVPFLGWFGRGGTREEREHDIVLLMGAEVLWAVERVVDSINGKTVAVVYGAEQIELSTAAGRLSRSGQLRRLAKRDGATHLLRAVGADSGHETWWLGQAGVSFATATRRGRCGVCVSLARGMAGEGSFDAGENAAQYGDFGLVGADAGDHPAQTGHRESGVLRILELDRRKDSSQVPIQRGHVCRGGGRPVPVRWQTLGRWIFGPSVAIRNSRQRAENLVTDDLDGHREVEGRVIGVGRNHQMEVAALELFVAQAPVFAAE